MAARGREPFGALLRRHRAVRGLTQTCLAERSGLSAQAISMLERGVRRAPRATTVELLATALKLDALERDALLAAARHGSPADGAADEQLVAGAAAAGRSLRRWRWPGAALAAVLLAGLVVAAPLALSHSPEATPGRPTDLIGARVADWPTGERAVGPLQTQRIFHRVLPASFPGTPESRLPAGVVPVVSYRARSVDVSSYVASVNRPIILIFQFNPERRTSEAAFVTAFEQQSRLIRSVRNRNVRVATSAMVYQYQPSLNPDAARCRYIPPASYVDYYLAAVFDPYLQGIDRTAGGGFVAWQACTRGLHRPRGLVEYGLGLGTPGSAACQPESRRTDVMYRDMAYLHQNVPDLALLEYWWNMRSGAACAQSWQFPEGSSTGDLWRTLAHRAFGL